MNRARVEFSVLSICLFLICMHLPVSSQEYRTRIRCRLWIQHKDPARHDMPANRIKFDGYGDTEHEALRHARELFRNAPGIRYENYQEDDFQFFQEEIRVPGSQPNVEAPPSPDELRASCPAYFDANGTAFYSPDGRRYYAFSSPRHRYIFVWHKPSSAHCEELGTQDPSVFGVYSGLATLPECYFSWNGTVFYSNGEGGGVAFTSPARATKHNALHPRVPSVGNLDQDPSNLIKLRRDVEDSGYSGPTYFNAGGTVFYSPDGARHYAFSSPRHYRIFEELTPKARDLGTQDPSLFGNLIGLATLPECYFSWNGTVFYSDGKGNGLAFTSPERLRQHEASHPHVPKAGTFDQDPANLIKCKVF